MQTCSSCGAENPELARFCNACGASLIAETTSAASRRPATVLFCDLADSTELTARLDPESVRRVVTRHNDETRSVVERHGGTVEKFIGDAVMAVFGIPQVHEDDAVRAVRAAAEMREALELLNKELERDWGVLLQTRTGLASGEVVTGDPSTGQAYATGGPVNLAARLEQAARPGEILLADATHRLVRDAVAAEELEPLLVKGLEEPVRAYRLLGVAPDAPRHARRFDSPLVDRERESTLLEQAFDRVASDRRCQLFTVLGPPGIGKSRLVDEFIRSRENRATVLRGRCLPYGEGITFWPVAETVEQAAALTDADPGDVAELKIGALVEGAASGPLVAERVGQAVGLTTGTAAPEETLWAIRTFYETLARERPLVLVFDDIHWAEQTFLELIEHIADWSRDAPIMVLCLARPELLEARPMWGGGKVNATTILLDPLRGDETHALVLNLLGAVELAPDLGARIVETAGGYPLYAEELVSVLIDDELLIREGDRWVAAPGLSELALPSTISGLLAARLDRLGAGERAVIERASVIGRDFYSVDVKGISPPEFRSHVEEHLLALVRKELVRPTTSKLPGEEAYRFRHMLIRDAAYDAMAKSVRAELHERYADWLEGRAPRIEEYEEIVAYHLEQAYRLLDEVGPRDEHLAMLARRAGERFGAAGRRALDRGDAAASTNLLRRASALLSDEDPARPEILADLHDALYYQGNIDEASSLLNQIAAGARAHGNAHLAARAELDRLWLAFMTTYPQEDALGEFQRGLDASVARLEELGDEWNLAAALELRATAYWITGDAGRMLLESERALELAGRVGNRRVGVSSASDLATSLMLGPTTCERASERMEALMESLAEDRFARATVGLVRGVVLAMLGRFDEARREAAGSHKLLADLGQKRWLADSASISGLIAHLQGNLDEAERELRVAYESFSAQRDAANTPGLACDLGRVLHELSRENEAEALAAEAAQAGEADIEPRVGWRRLRALVLARKGAFDEAERLAREALELVTPTDFITLHADALLDLAQVLEAAGRFEEATVVLVEALDLYERKGNAVGARRAGDFLARIR